MKTSEIRKVLESAKGFDWNRGNIDKNWKRHQVDFRECEEIFFNQPLLINPDEKHSKKERRFQALGKTDRERRLFIVFVIRGGKVRIISARDQSRKEKNQYEKA